MYVHQLNKMTVAFIEKMDTMIAINFIAHIERGAKELKWFDFNPVKH